MEARVSYPDMVSGYQCNDSVMHGAAPGHGLLQAARHCDKSASCTTRASYEPVPQRRAEFNNNAPLGDPSDPTAPCSVTR